MTLDGTVASRRGEPGDQSRRPKSFQEFMTQLFGGMMGGGGRTSK
jgi:hypothetical protein